LFLARVDKAHHQPVGADFPPRYGAKLDFPPRYGAKYVEEYHAWHHSSAVIVGEAATLWFLTPPLYGSSHTGDKQKENNAAGRSDPITAP